MPRPVIAMLLACCALAACGSDEERTVRASATKTPEGHRECQSMVAVASNGAKLDKETRAILKELREAQDDEDATVLCASDVDSIPDQDGWTPYAPVPDSTPTP